MEDIFDGDDGTLRAWDGPRCGTFIYNLGVLHGQFWEIIGTHPQNFGIGFSRSTSLSRNL